MHIEFYLLCAVLGMLVLRGIVFRQHLFEYPTIVAMLGLAWVVPEGIELETREYYYFSSGAFWLYVTACFLFIVWGFHVGRKAQAKRIGQTPTKAVSEYYPRRLLVAAAGLTAFGIASGVMIRTVDTSGMTDGWTGIVTMYTLFAQGSTMGLCLAMLTFARTGSRGALLIAIAAAIPSVIWALSGVRRESLFDLVILSAGSWYFSKHKFPPRAAVIACLVVGTVILNKAGDLRGYVESNKGTLIGAILSEDLYEDFDYFELHQGESSEVGLAQYDFWYVNHTGRWEYGAELWNSMVSQYVPAFAFGRDFKDSLTVDTLTQRLRLGEEQGAYANGSTRTGFSDTYRSFGALGVLLFGLIGYGFGRLYAVAARGGLAGQYFYLILLAEGLKAITHSAGSFLAALPFAILLSLPALRFARVPAAGSAAARGMRANSSRRFRARPGRATPQFFSRSGPGV